MKNTKEHTAEELSSKKKTLSIAIMVMSGLIVLHGVYFVLSLLSGTWEANNTFGAVGLGMLVIIVSNLGLRLSLVQKEIKSRNASN